MRDEFSGKELQPGEWFKKAEDDELSAKAVLKEGAPSTACFLSQQMAEKYLKAFLVHHKKWYPKIHPLDALWELCREIDESFDDIKQDAVFITSFYVETRYPGDYPEFTFDECRKTFEAAVRVKEFVLEKIKLQNKNGFGALAILAVIAGLLVVAGGGYWFFGKYAGEREASFPAPSVRDSVSEDTARKSYTSAADISGWKTYRNEQYGFEVKYPSPFQVNIKESTRDEIEIKNYRLFYTLTINDPQGIEYFHLDVWNDLANYAPLFQGFLPRVLEQTQRSGQKNLIKRAINNVNGVEIYGPEQFGYQDNFYAIKNDLVWTVALDPVNEGRITAAEFLKILPAANSYRSKDSQIYKDIFSTFKSFK